MFKRVISILLCVLMVAGCTLCLGACKSEEDENYPVTVSGLTIENEPENIVVLSDCLADVISYIKQDSHMSYDVKMVGRNAETTQEFLSVVPSVGTIDNIDVNAIVAAETNLVIADSTLSGNVKAQLEEAGIPVLILDKAKTFDELKVLFTNLGTALGGKVTGKKNGTDSFDALLKTLKDFKAAIPNDVVKTACYLYLNENNELCTLTKGTVEFDLFAYNGAINIFSSQETPVVDLEQLKIGTPTFIFYNDQSVLDYLNSDAELSTMRALSEDHTYQINLSDFNRQGTTYEEMTYRMLEFMFITSEATPDEATPEEATVTDSTETTETQTTEEDGDVVGFISDAE